MDCIDDGTIVIDVIGGTEESSLAVFVLHAVGDSAVLLFDGAALEPSTSDAIEKQPDDDTGLELGVMELTSLFWCRSCTPRPPTTRDDEGAVQVPHGARFESKGKPAIGSRSLCTQCTWSIEKAPHKSGLPVLDR